MIVPKLDDGAQPIVIGISGRIAAGKTTLAEAFQNLGFMYTRFSLVIDDELRKRGLPLGRANRQAMGSELNRIGRQRWLAEQTLLRVGEARTVVVDGLRFPEDHAFLAERAGSNYFHVFVDASEEERKKRYSARADDGNFETVAASEAERQVSSMSDLAHHVFLNEKTVDDVGRWAAELAAEVREKICRYPS